MHHFPHMDDDVYLSSSLEGRRCLGASDVRGSLGGGSFGSLM